MTDWKPQQHATTNVARDENGEISYIKCRAEYFEENVDAADTQEGSRFAEGVSATFRFDVVDDDLAVLDAVKDVEDDASHGYTTSLEFLRALPIALGAVSEIPGVEHVQDPREKIHDELERGEQA